MAEEKLIFPFNWKEPEQSIFHLLQVIPLRKEKRSVVLNKWEEIEDLEVYLSVLLRDAQQGPNNIRAQYGALQDDAKKILYPVLSFFLEQQEKQLTINKDDYNIVIGLLKNNLTLLNTEETIFIKEHFQHVRELLQKKIENKNFDNIKVV